MASDAQPEISVVYEIFKLAGQAGPVLLLLWYLLTKELPRIQDRFHDQLNADRDVFRSELGAQREESKEERRVYADSVGRITGQMQTNHIETKTALDDIRSRLRSS